MPATTVANWAKSKVHDVTLPSATKVKIALPNLAALLKAGAIPNSLVEAALKVQRNDNVDVDTIKENAEYEKLLVSKTVIEPEVTVDDVDKLPYEDVGMLVELATRQRDVDAVGHHLAGLETVPEWRKFRGLDVTD